MDPLLALRSSIRTNISPILLSSTQYSQESQLPDDAAITSARALFFPATIPYVTPFVENGEVGVAIPLSTPTRYVINNSPINLETVYHVWSTKDLKVTDYIRVSGEQNINHLKTVYRTDLLDWLKGSDESSNVVDAIPTSPLDKGGKDESAQETTRDDESSAVTKTNGDSSSKVASESKELNGKDASNENGPQKTASNFVNPLDVVTVIEEELPQMQPPTDPLVDNVYKNERSLLNHNTVLHGSKTIDFSLIAKDCHEQIINVVKTAHSTSSRSSQHSRHNGHSSNTQGSFQSRNSGPRTLKDYQGALINKHHSNGRSSSHPSSGPAYSRSREPIIILSPSTSALINMGNVKAFLENGEFIPQMSGLGSPNLLHITRKSPRFPNSIRFTVVDSVERFTKPEYWDRVVAVFVTGQAWQFKNYRWSNPNELFQKVAGFYVGYHDEKVPESLGTWNVNVSKLMRNERFKDREAAEYIWNNIERWMVSRGWASRN